jgi:hypothetical protein
MPKMAAALLFLFGLSCEEPLTHTTRVPAPHGGVMYVIECRYYSANCYQQASHVCPNGYDITDNALGKRREIAVACR